MNKKQLLLLILFCVVLIAAVFFLASKKSLGSGASRLNAAKSLVKDFDVNSICKIVLKTGSFAIAVQKKNGSWIVMGEYEYPADFELVSAFVRKVRDLKPMRSYPSEYSSSFYLFMPGKDKKRSGTFLELFDENGTTKVAVLLGKFHFPKVETPNPYATPEPNGRYAMNVKEKSCPVLVAEPLLAAVPFAMVWLDKKLFRMTGPKSISSADPKGTILWELARKAPGGNFSMAGPSAALNKAVLKQFFGALFNLTFTGVKPLEKSEVSSIKNNRTIIVETFDGIRYDIKLGSKGQKHYLNLDLSYKGDKKNLPEKFKKDKFYTKWLYEIPAQIAQILQVNKKNISE